EVVKDMEDIRGDQSEHCNTIPLQWGINRAKGVVNATVILLILVVCIFFYTTIQLSTTVWLYWIVTVVIPLFFTLYKLKRAVQSVQFHQVSSWLKWITLAGIASMCLL
ncbi:MAG TPA: ubiquinone biosynthesis protein UbiA, partial [Chitinophagaceae bacterium]|nr:ubiquinone biosynthesis protein UbiA [Chitinophagaceae bacterium]